MLQRMTTETLKSRIEQKLAELEISARKASIEAGGSPDLLRPLLSGRTDSLRTTHLISIAKVLQTTPEWLMTGRETADTPDQPIVPEIDVRAGAGGGGLASSHRTLDEHGNSIEADNVSATWSIPPAYLRGELRVDPRRIYIIEVLGDSMLPTLHSGDRAMVDTSHTMPSPPGVYALHDGYGLIVKRLELIPGTDPQRVLVISDNQHHRERELTLDEINIVGRVVARVSAM